MRGKIFFSIFLALFILTFFVSGLDIIGGSDVSFTGRASSQSYNVSIYINSAPSLTIVSPLNQTYNSSVIDFNVTADENLDYCTFSLDNWITNYSMTQYSPDYWHYTNGSVSDGSYEARFWCNDSSGLSSDASVNFSVERITGTWDYIEYPEGVYEPYNAGLIGTHLFNFRIKFVDLSASSGDTLECEIKQSDGSIFDVNETLSSTIIDSNYSINYTLQNSDSIDKSAPWKILNCSLYDSSRSLLVSNDSDYYSHNNKSILVHGNTWTKFDGATHDAYLAGLCFLGWPKHYFNNSLYCDYIGDVAFSVSMASSFFVEGYCHDEIDGDLNGDTDCSDRYCRGIPYSCIDHDYAGDPFEGTCTNGVCTDSRTIGGHEISYTYNRYVEPDGTLKVRFDGGDYSTTKPILFAITDLVANDYDNMYGNYTDSYSLPNVSHTATSIVAQDESGYTGDIDMVLWVNLSSGNYSAGNEYNFSLYIVQEGFDLLIAGNPVIIDSSAPSVWDESDIGTSRTNPCSSSVDEDIDYSNNCVDSDCDGELGGTSCDGGAAYCESPEATCYDCFDNDADGNYDCGDSDCDLKAGNYLDLTDLCHYSGEGKSDYDASIYPWTDACADSFNNDQEDGVDCYDVSYCRDRGGSSTTLPCPAYENNSDAWCFDSLDNDYDSSVDCRDQDCLGVSYGGQICSTNESIDINGNVNPYRCFDGFDNDFDGDRDCADKDCVGITYDGFTCLGVEFNYTIWVNNSMVDNAVINASYCADTVDNDGDGPIDCSDSDCKQKFGVCGPCPSYENRTWDACANSRDDNTDGQKDCADTAECDGEIGSKSSGQLCSSAESASLCGDGFDNDADGDVDCADSGCSGASGPEGQVCGAETSDALCNDNEDNDADGDVDCVDSDCYSSSVCSAKGWTSVSCTIVPYTESSNQIASTSINVTNLKRHYVNTDYVISVSGTSSSYESVTLTFGSASSSSDYFPYNASACTLSGDTGSLRWVSSQEEIGQIQDKGSTINGGFSVTLTCPGESSSQEKTYPIGVTNELSGGSTENGEEDIDAAVYENTASSVSSIEVEPYSSGDVDITYGESYSLRAIPSSDSSGICKCLFDIDGNEFNSSDGDCIYSTSALYDDDSYSVSARALDGVNNLGSSGGSTSLNVNVMPKQNTMLIGRSNYPFYNSSKSESVTFASSFSTASSGSISSCFAWVEDSSGSLVTSKSISPTGGSTASCDDSFSTSALSEGLYYIVVNATDEDGDVVTSDKKVFYNCPSYGDSYVGCGRADFDGDGNPDSANCAYGLSYSIDLLLTLNITRLLNVTGENMTISLYPSDSLVYLNQTITNESDVSFTLSNGVYDLQFDTFDNELSAKISGVSIIESTNASVLFDRVNNTDDYQFIYEVDSDLVFSSAEISLDYSNVSYGDVNDLVVYQCSEWNRTLKDCTGTWSALTSTVNTSSMIVSASTSSLTAFAVGEFEEDDGVIVIGGGGGGGGSKALPVELQVDPPALTVNTIVGETKVKKLIVRNVGDNDMGFDVVVEGDIKDFVSTITRIELKAGEQKEVVVLIDAPEKSLLLGNIVFKTRNYRKEVPVVVNIKSQNFLFDIFAKVLGDYKQILPGGVVKVQFDLIEVGAGELVDVTAIYSVRDFYGNLYYEESETFAVLDEKSYVKEFNVSDLGYGKYLVVYEVLYPGEFGTASSQFEVVDVIEKDYTKIVLLITAVFALIVIVWVSRWAYYRRKRVHGRAVKRKHKKLP